MAGSLPARDPLVDYLKSTNGSDILVFQDQAAATEAARTLRARHPTVGVDARYDKVFLRLPQEVPKEDKSTVVRQPAPKRA